MSSEIEVSETPNWLKELEEKREKRVKARLGHEAGAGAPCLKCADKCPGLDLHFWRKCCKNCKCSKEEHEVQDDDIYGWAQFQLLGSKPNKIKRKILLPGKKDEIDLEWVPKGHNDIIDKYLKTLPPEQLPVKGSQAAQDRKQLLQKQIPIHDIDPTLCHELTDEELTKMNEYISHVKQASVGVGQLVTLSSIIKGKLHMLNPAEAAIIASRYAKGVPISEIVKLQGQNKVGTLGHNLEKLNITNNSLPAINPSEYVANPLASVKIREKEYPLYCNETNTTIPNSQFSSEIGPKHNKNNFLSADPINNQIGSKPTSLDFNSQKSAFVPYQKVSVPKPGDMHYEDNVSLGSNFSKDITPGNGRNYNNFANKNNYSRQGIDPAYEYAEELKHPSHNLPNYAPGKFTTYSDTQNPTKIPTSIKDFAFSTYDPTQSNENDFKNDKYKQPNNNPHNFNAFRPIEAEYYRNPSIYYQNDQQFEPVNPNVSRVVKSQGIGSGTCDSNVNPSNINNQEMETGEIKSGYPDQVYGTEPRQQWKNNDKSTPSGNFNANISNTNINHPYYEGFEDKQKMYNTPELNVLGKDTSTNKLNKNIPELHPNDLKINEDFLNPEHVNIGSIKDINYPFIKAATQETSDFYEEYSPESLKEILNNVILPDCHYCKKPFEENEFAVTIDRANVLFHAECFKCAGCNQILADNIYFYNKETDNIYCLRDYAKIRGCPRCKACDELIFTKEYCLAENSTFHLKHFCCTECDTPLAGQDYLLEEEMPYCLPCFEQNKASKCNSCERVIKPDEVGCNLKGIHFHATDACFSCKVCKVPLMGKKFLLRNNRLYCSHECYGRE